MRWFSAPGRRGTRCPLLRRIDACDALGREALDAGIAASSAGIKPGEPRPNPRIASRHVPETDSVAEDAVLIGPVSTSISLLTGN
jgi:hypothetical protein